MVSPFQSLDRIVRRLRSHPALRALARAAHGAEIYLVGGLLRDRLLGLPSRDADVVVAGRGREIATEVARELEATLVPLGADRHAAFRIVGGLSAADTADPAAGAASEGWVLDLWDRQEMTVEQDLARRDFTVNSFAVRLRDGRVTDPFGGLVDLAHRRLRATTEESFRGDPLRVLRLPRLLGALPGFSAGAGTLELARASASDLTEVAAERVRAELALIFLSRDAPRGLALLHALGVYPALWLGSLGDPDVDPADRAAATAVRALTALTTVRRALRTIDLEADEAVHPLAVRLALTFRGLVEKGNAAQQPPATSPVECFAAAGYLTRRVAHRVERILAHGGLPDDDLGRRHFLHDLNELWPSVAAYAGAAAGETGFDDWTRRLRPLAELAAREGSTLFSPPKLVGGDEVQTILGVPPGPAVGRALAEVRRAQVEGELRDREGALALLRKLAAETARS